MAGFSANEVLGCQNKHVYDLDAPNRLKKLLIATPECHNVYDKIEYFAKTVQQNEMMAEAASLANAGDSAGACELINKLLNDAEIVRTGMVACYHALPTSSASEEQTRLKQAALMTAGQMHSLQEQLAPAI